MCADMWEANKAVKREKPLMPTIDDLVAELNGATVFSKLDLLSGYHQLELEPESRNITTFSTHIGLWRYKRLMFGINAASENDVMSYFDPRLKTEVIVDASPVGLGGLLVQDSKIISYASRALGDVESISICSNRKGNAGSHLYLYGSEFIITTDNKALLGIFQQSQDNFSAHRQMEAEAHALQLSTYLLTWQRRRESSRFYELPSK